MKTKICLVAALTLIFATMMFARPVWNQPKPLVARNVDHYWQDVSNRHFAYYVDFRCGGAGSQCGPPPPCNAR